MNDLDLDVVKSNFDILNESGLITISVMWVAFFAFTVLFTNASWIASTNSGKCRQTTNSFVTRQKYPRASAKSRCTNELQTPTRPHNAPPTNMAKNVSTSSMVFFVINDGGIYAANLSRGQSVLNATYDRLSIEGLRATRSVAYDPVERVVYWTDPAAAMISRAAIDGSWQSLVVDNLTDIKAGELTLEFQDRKIYWVNYRGNSIERVDFIGTNRKLIHRGRSYSRGIAVDSENRVLFWMERGILVRSDLNGGNVQTVTKSFGSGTACILFDSQAKRLLFADKSTNAVYSIQPNGTDLSQLIQLNGTFFSHIAVYNGMLVWSSYIQNLIGQVSLSNTSAFEVIDNLPTVKGPVPIDDINNVHVYSG